MVRTGYVGEDLCRHFPQMVFVVHEKLRKVVKVNDEGMEGKDGDGACEEATFGEANQGILDRGECLESVERAQEEGETGEVTVDLVLRT